MEAWKMDRQRTVILESWTRQREGVEVRGRRYQAHFGSRAMPGLAARGA
jgi:hypothetical protein